jgi:hypothetical protein
MRIVSTNVYVGPNLYAHFPVIRHVLDLGELEDWPTGRLGAAFVDPLLVALPGLNEQPREISYDGNVESVDLNYLSIGVTVSWTLKE